MKNGGYVALGHLLAMKPSSSSPNDCKKTLRDFCSVLFGRMDETTVHKSNGFWRFDEFFQNIEPTAENMAKFLTGILKQPHVDDYKFQLGIEHVVWDIIKFSYDRFCSNSLMREDLFRLFCIFNRMCDPECLLLGNSATSFLFGKFLKTPSAKFEASYKNLAESLSNWQKIAGIHYENYVIIIKKLYDDYVRDIIIESRVKFRLPYKTSIYGKGSILKKTISITSKNLTVYEDEEDRITNLDVPTKREPTGKIIHEMSLVGCEHKIAPNSKGIFASKSKKFDVLAIRSSGSTGSATGVDIMFDTGKEIYDVCAWTNAIKECMESINSNSNRLIRLREDLLQYSLEDIPGIKNTGTSRYNSLEMENKNAVLESEKETNGLYRYSDMPFPPNKPTRKSLQLSDKRKSISLKNVSETIVEETSNRPRIHTNSTCIFNFSNHEALNVIGFLSSDDSGDLTPNDDLKSPSIEKTLGTHKRIGSKKRPPKKPTRKVIETTNANKRYQSQYADIHTQKMSESAGKDNRSNSFSEYGGNEPDIVLSCSNKYRSYSKKTSDEMINDKLFDNIKEENIKTNENAEIFEEEKDNKIVRQESTDELVSRYSSLIEENLNFEERGSNDCIVIKHKIVEKDIDNSNTNNGCIPSNYDIEDNTECKNDKDAYEWGKKDVSNSITNSDQYIHGKVQNSREIEDNSECKHDKDTSELGKIDVSNSITNADMYIQYIHGKVQKIREIEDNTERKNDKDADELGKKDASNSITNADMYIQYIHGKVQKIREIEDHENHKMDKQHEKFTKSMIVTSETQDDNVWESAEISPNTMSIQSRRQTLSPEIRSAKSVRGKKLIVVLFPIFMASLKVHSNFFSV